MTFKLNINKNKLIIGTIILLLEILLCIFTYYSINAICGIILYTVGYVALTVFYIYEERKKIVNIKTVFIGLYSLMIGISPIVYCLTDFKVQETLYYQFPIFLLGYLCLIFGFNFQMVKKSEKVKNDNYDAMKIFAIIILCVSLLANILFFSKNMELFLSGDLENARIDAQAGNGAIIAIGSLIFPSIGMLYYCYKNGVECKKVLIFALIVFIILNIIKGSRTPIVKMVLLIVLIFNNYKKINFKKIFRIGIYILIILVALQVLRNCMSGLNSNFFTEMKNILINGSINFNYIYKTFPGKVNFQHGYSYLINFIMLRPGSDPDFTLWLKDIIGLSYAGGGLTPTLVGESYLNFGIIGIILSMILTGVLGNFLNERYFDKESCPFWISYLIVTFIDMFRGGFANIELNLLTVLILYTSYKIFKEKIFYLRRKNE